MTLSRSTAKTMLIENAQRVVTIAGSNTLLQTRSNNILKSPTEHFTENLREILAESLADISSCLLDLFNDLCEPQFFTLFFCGRISTT